MVLQASKNTVRGPPEIFAFFGYFNLPQHSFMLASKILENRGPEDVRTSPVRFWKVPGEFISLPGRSGEVVGGFGEVVVRFYEGQEGRGR